MNIRSTGWLPDPVSSADWDANELSASSSSLWAVSHSNADLVPEVYDQGSLGACTAFATGLTLRGAVIKQLREDGVLNAVELSKTPSFLFLYYLARATHGMAAEDSGSWIRANFEVVNRFGWPDEEFWPYDDRKEWKPNGRPPKFARLPSHKAFRAAYDRRSEAPKNKKLVEYRRIYETGYARVQAVKKWSKEGYLIPFGTDVDEKFLRGDFNEGRPIYPPVGESRAGGHAMVIEGFNGDDFTIVNSWGRNYGINGRCIFSADYIAWDKSRDFWIARRVPAEGT